MKLIYIERKTFVKKKKLYLFFIKNNLLNFKTFFFIFYFLKYKYFELLKKK